MILNRTKTAGNTSELEFNKSIFKSCNQSMFKKEIEELQNRRDHRKKKSQTKQIWIKWGKKK